MPNQTRVVKVLATLLASMTIGAIFLLTLGHNPPSAGPFSLWTYCCLDPVRDAMSSKAEQSIDRWNRVEVFYSGTESSNPELLDLINCHFFIFNGFDGVDGKIQSTENWQNQWSAMAGGSAQTIRICVVANGKNVRPTDCQIKRIQLLVEELCREFRILSESVFYPDNWR